MAATDQRQALVPSPAFRNKVEEASGQRVSACFQCEKCTNGCPVTFAMDIVPHKLIRSVHMGLKDRVLNSDTIWVCASCETCTARCPNGIDIARVMDALRQISQAEGVKPSQKLVPVFHSAFLSSMKRHGRVHELEMTLNYTLKSAGWQGLVKQSGMGLDMFKKGKLKLLPARLRGGRQVKRIFDKAEGKK